MVDVFRISERIIFEVLWHVFITICANVATLHGWVGLACKNKSAGCAPVQMEVLYESARYRSWICTCYEVGCHKAFGATFRSFAAHSDGLEASCPSHTEEGPILEQD